MADYPTTTFNVAKATVNPLRKNAYDPDGHEIPMANAFNVRRNARWKGYNGYWKTMLSLKVTKPAHKVYAQTENFDLTYYLTGNNRTAVRKRGMYGY